MDEDGEDLVVPVGTAQLLFGPDLTLEHRVHRLEVARVGHHLHRQLAALGVGVGALGPEVVLDVARALDRLRAQTLELAEDPAVALPDDVGQDVEPAAVGHPDDDLLHPVLGGGVEHGVEQRDEALRPLQPEPLVPEVLGVEEPLEGLGLVELAQRAEPLLAGQLRAGRLHPLLDPRLLRRLLDVHVLDAGGPAVGESRRWERASPSFITSCPPRPPVANSRSRSQMVSP